MEIFPNLQTWASTNVETAVFYLLAVIAIPLAYGVIFDRQIIRSGFLLIGVFSTIAGLYLVLEAQFLALAQVMIYAVGITLVVVIALMLTNPKLERDLSPSIVAQRLPGIMVAIFLFMTIYVALRSEPWLVSTEPVHPQPAKWIGFLLMRDYALPFEFASVLLLIALIGAVMLAKADEGKMEEKSLNGDSTAERVDDVVKV
jgi:NAD(P)H-quinone oxidoreductase subunit 6